MSEQLYTAAGLIVRQVAHLFGWHTNFCRGQSRCWSATMRVRLYRPFAGWWRL